MLKKLFFSTFSVGLLIANPYTIIEDQSDLPLLSVDLQERSTVKMELPNGLQILLISDPNADQSAACAVVGSGSWSDPVEYPGMAHFCEHMLFMGTEKYPDTNGFFSELTNYSGSANAYTASNRTAYMFVAQEKGFLSLLDQFAHFFIDPLFDPSNISREMHAVDQEFALHKEHDGWREQYVSKELSNPEHPHHLFSTGNAQTLSNIPQSVLKKWHKEHYGANRMKLVLYSSLPLETLKNVAAESFQKVPSISEPVHKVNTPVTSLAQKKHIVLIEPIKNVQLLTLSWELDEKLRTDPTKAAELVAYTLERGGEKSLVQKLKSEGLIDAMSTDIERPDGEDCAFFEVTFALSDRGAENLSQVITSFFQALKNLKVQGIPKDLFKERDVLTKLDYQFQKRVDAFQYVSTIGRTLLNEPLATYPRHSLLGTDYDATKVQDVVEFLKPHECSISYLAPKAVTKALYDRQEKWLSIPYTVQPIPEDWLSQWSEVSEQPEIVLTEPNPFIPQDLSIVADPKLGTAPVCLAETTAGSLYYARLNEYQTPQSALRLKILSPELQLNAKSQVLASLYIDHLTDLLHANLTAASSAQINAQFESQKNWIQLTISGFSDPMPLLIRTIAKQMPLNTPTKEQFKLYQARHQKYYENQSKELPIRQNNKLLLSLINEGCSTPMEHLQALEAITFEDFQLFHKKLFEKVYLQALFAGNLSVKTVESSWLDITHSLVQSPYMKEEIVKLKALHLPEEEGPFLISRQTQAQGNATVLLLDQGNATALKKAVQQLLSTPLHESFFDTLRTKQKTGYIAQSHPLESEKRLYQCFQVQSNTHQPEDLLHRFELFLEEFLESLTTEIPLDRFQMLKESTIETLQTRYRNIDLKAELYHRLTFDENGNFSFIDQQVQVLKDLRYEEFLAMTRELLSRSNHRRLAILCTGQIESPFVYMPTTTENFGRVVTYAPKPIQNDL